MNLFKNNSFSNSDIDYYELFDYIVDTVSKWNGFEKYAEELRKEFKKYLEED